MNEDIEDKEFESEDFEHALRPKGFEDFRGQDQIVGNLKGFIQAAKERQDALDHVLLHGPPGLGKTTLSYIIANELSVGIITTSGPVLDKPACSKRLVISVSLAPSKTGVAKGTPSFKLFASSKISSSFIFSTVFL